MISIVCPSKKGSKIAFKLQKSLNAKLYIKEDESFELKNVESENLDNTNKYKKYFNLNSVAKEAMETCDKVIFICSTGIAVRAIAPFIQTKDKDPGVVVVDVHSKYAINILSGHLGGGNELTLKVANLLNAQPIITTATDNMGIVAPDIIAKNNNLIIDDLKNAKHIAALLVNGNIVGIKDDYNMVKITKGYEKLEELKEESIWITHNLKWNKHRFENNSSNSKCNINDTTFNECRHNNSELDYSKILKLIKRDIVLGIGCRKNTPYEKIKAFIENSLEYYNFDIRSVDKIVSVDVKKNEEGIIMLAKELKCPFITFEREKIKAVQDKYEKSEFVLKTLGITGVCEPCVDLGCAEVIVSKIKYEGMTLAIGVLK